LLSNTKFSAELENISSKQTEVTWSVHFRRGLIRRVNRQECETEREVEGRQCVLRAHWQRASEVAVESRHQRTSSACRQH